LGFRAVEFVSHFVLHASDFFIPMSHDLSPTSAAPFAPELRWLARLHYALAILTAATAPLGGYLMYLGWSLLKNPAASQRYDGPAIFDPLVWGATWFMAGGVLATLSLLHGAILWYVGRQIAARRRRRFCLIFSICDLTYVPIGAALALFAIILLTRPQVKSQFDQD
jgi:hypothetical protein